MAKIDIEKSKNEDSMKLLLSRLNHRLDRIKLGGGEAKIEKQHKKG
jgi:3-methylcrotonyl-CoA carboxylase beta subunit